jgi:glycosyltransferase involved in cell wall biosynthesis
VPDHTSTKEIFEGYGELIRTEHVETDPNYSREMHNPSADHLTEILNDLYHDPERRRQVGEACYQRVTDPQFSWDTVASQFGGIFEDVMKEVDHSVPIEIGEKPKKQKKERKSRRKELAGFAS